MKNIIFLTTLLFSNFLFSQSVETEFAIQIFTSFDRETTQNETSTLLDEFIIETVYIGNKLAFRVIIPVDNLEKAKEILQVYKESYNDCFILIKTSNKKIN